MDETKRAWDEVGEGLAKFGRRVSERYRQLGEERGSEPGTADDASRSRGAAPRSRNVRRSR